MHPSVFVGVAAVGLIVAGSTRAEVRGQWQPADCASVEAKSLEAELLKCDPATLGLTAAGAQFSVVDNEDEAAPLPNALATSSLASGDLTSIGTQADW